jgi:hypothetical protein
MYPAWIWSQPVFPNLGAFHCGAPEVYLLSVILKKMIWLSDIDC